jgi:hypothetical protein
MTSINQFITDKRIETLNYELLCTRKDLKEMTVLVQANSTTITDLLGLIREQNKSLTELRREVESLKSELGVLKKVDSVLEKVEKVEKQDQEEFIVESKSEEDEQNTNMADIPKDDIFRYFEFNKSWQDSELIKKWGDSKVVYSVAFNVLPLYNLTHIFNGIVENKNFDFGYNYCQSIVNCVEIVNDANQLNSKKVECKPCLRYIFDKPKSIKNSILEVERFFQLKTSKSYMDIICCTNDESRFTYQNFPRVTMTECLSKQIVNGFFLRGNNVSANLVEMESLLVLRIG